LDAIVKEYWPSLLVVVLTGFALTVKAVTVMPAKPVSFASRVPLALASLKTSPLIVFD
jgi:hypothetical protein